MILGYKDIRLRKSEFVAKTEFLYKKESIYLYFFTFNPASVILVYDTSRSSKLTQT